MIQIVVMLNVLAPSVFVAIIICPNECVCHLKKPVVSLVYFLSSSYNNFSVKSLTAEIWKNCYCFL
jgi:hypothetical protein